MWDFIFSIRYTKENSSYNRDVICTRWIVRLCIFNSMCNGNQFVATSWCNKIQTKFIQPASWSSTRTRRIREIFKTNINHFRQLKYSTNQWTHILCCRSFNISAHLCYFNSQSRKWTCLSIYLIIVQYIQKIPVLYKSFQNLIETINEQILSMGTFSWMKPIRNDEMNQREKIERQLSSKEIQKIWNWRFYISCSLFYKSNFSTNLSS